ncbi:hypothetical protein DOY81_009979 [Sarcophaga bullata]|nr:hypothetical protein DOY81_009979 [Sarcophaga bullata]
MENLESQNALPAVAHVEPPTGSDYQNTPFSIIRDQQQEPVLKNKKPLLLCNNKIRLNKARTPFLIP